MQNTEENFTYYDEEMEYLLDFIREWEEKHPGEEMIFLTLPKHDPDERKRILQSAMRMLCEEGIA